RQKRVGRQQGRLVGQRVDDGRLVGAHGVSPGIGQILTGFAVNLAATLSSAFSLMLSSIWAAPNRYPGFARRDRYRWGAPGGRWHAIALMS
ncbi:MAG TPA: hypothetical protein VN897_13065, partial [Mycobacterium sp.]|nr:hypothetical protein [Mycobacterium sp.]